MKHELIDDSIRYIAVKNFLAENYRYRYEACLFLLQEVDFVKRMCIIESKTGNNSFIKHLEKKSDLLSEVLRILNKQLDQLYNNSGTCGDASWFNLTAYNILSWFDYSIAILSESMQDTTTYLTQRRFRSASSLSLFQTPIKLPRVRMSEVHIDYPDTLRAVEALVDDYFINLRNSYFPPALYDGLEFVAPVIAISRGQSFIWKPCERKGFVPLFVYDPELKGYISANNAEIIKDMQDIDFIDTAKMIKKYARYIFNFSCVETPRYFPVMIRYSSILAHELAHPVIRMAELIFEKDAYIKFSLFDENANDVKEVFSKLSENFGIAMAELVRDRIQLQDAILRFFEKVYRLSIEGSKEKKLKALLIGPDCREKMSEEEARSDELFHCYRALFHRKSKTFAKEILADIFGLILGNEPFLLGQILQSLSTPDGIYEKAGSNPFLIDKYLVESSHPPVYVRAMILIDLSRKFGFEEAADKAKEFVEDFKINMELNDAFGTTWDIWGRFWWNDIETQLIIKDIINHIGQYTKRSDLYELASNKMELSYRCFDQKKLGHIQDLITKWIDEGNICFGDMNTIKLKILEYLKMKMPATFRLKPSDVLGALWRKLVIHEDVDRCERQRLQWRLAMSKNFEEPYG